MDILQQMLKRAQANPQRIVLPEGDEPRTLEAANIILRDKVAKLILIGDPDKIKGMAHDKGYEYISQAEILNPKTDPRMEGYAQLLYELRKKKGMTEEEARLKAQDPLYLGCLMIKSGDADGELAGARGTTADTIRPAFQILKTKPGVGIVSGAFLMFTPAHQLGEDGFLVFADCAVNPCPNAQELAQIAISTAETARTLAGIEPRVAMLS
ncbi:MAG TPA: phosphate acetyltransferase, partial [Bacteroidales bacterium]|nr:phosphate acetyltransferase [Bacteroidales bacterium]